MTDTRFETSLNFTLQWEGSRYTDNPNDPGGATRYGVTQRTFDSYRSQKGLPHVSVRDITMEEVQDIYRTMYWQPAHCEDLPDGLDTVQFDTSVNMGVQAAMRFLQRAVGTKPDGLWGPKTASSIKEDAPATVVTNYLDERVARYEALAEEHPREKEFLKGWLNRVQALRTFTSGA